MWTGQGEHAWWYSLPGLVARVPRYGLVNQYDSARRQQRLNDTLNEQKGFPLDS